jgi:hypothetical protein
MRGDKMELEGLLDQARQNCVTRAESLLESELAMVKAKYQSRLNPPENLILLEALKLELQESKSAFADSDVQGGLELFSHVHGELKNLAYKLSYSR